MRSALDNRPFVYGDYSPILHPVAVAAIISNYSPSLAGQIYQFFSHYVTTLFALPCEHLTLDHLLINSTLAARTTPLNVKSRNALRFRWY
jgi:hypothetical protein